MPSWRAGLTVYMPIYADVELLKYSLRNFNRFPRDTQFIFVLDRVNGYTQWVIRRYVKTGVIRIFHTVYESWRYGWRNHLNFLIRNVDYYFRYSDYILFTQADVILDIDTILNNYRRNQVVCYSQRLGLRWDLPRAIHRLFRGKMFSGIYTIDSDLYYRIRPEANDPMSFENKVSRYTDWIEVKSKTVNLRPYTRHSLYRMGRLRRRLGTPFYKQLLWSLLYLDFNSLRGYLDEAGEVDTEEMVRV